MLQVNPSSKEHSSGTSALAAPEKVVGFALEAMVERIINQKKETSAIKLTL